MVVGFFVVFESYTVAGRDHHCKGEFSQSKTGHDTKPQRRAEQF